MLRKLSNKDTRGLSVQLSQVNLPVHLIWGMDDKFQPWEVSGQKLLSSFKYVKVSKMDNCGHYLQLDQPERYVELLLGTE